MTYKIKYLPLAVQDLNDVARYLSGFYPKTASRVLKEMRERITKLIENAKQNFAQENKTNGKPYQLSAPMGYAVSNLSAETIGDFMNRIDRQMYQDKLAYYEEFPIVKDTTPNMMNPRLYTTSYNKPQGQQFDDTAVLSFIKLQYT